MWTIPRWHTKRGYCFDVSEWIILLNVTINDLDRVVLFSKLKIALQVQKLFINVAFVCERRQHGHDALLHEVLSNSSEMSSIVSALLWMANPPTSLPSLLIMIIISSWFDVLCIAHCTPSSLVQSWTDVRWCPLDVSWRPLMSGHQLTSADVSWRPLMSRYVRYGTTYLM